MKLHQEKELSNGSGRPLSYNSFTNKKAKWLLLEAVCVGVCGGVCVCVCFFFFFAFSVILQDSCPHLSLFKARVLQMTTNFELV